MKFVLEIELGNDCMQTGADVADGLSRLSGLQSYEVLLAVGDFGIVKDANGNTVGRYDVV